ncbi:MAG: hypothetical protein Q4B54_07335 [Coriobacteriales bacterium]|nr:hypothetical protein [Coriobacteriales bacterium]
MGVYIRLKVSKSVTSEEWQEVYQETLKLIKAFPLAERREVPVRGVSTICLVRTEEREESYGWKQEKVETGWFADSDYETLRKAETFFLPRDLVETNEYEADAPDAVFAMVPAYLNGYEWNDDRFSHNYSPWDAKTQGEPYHMYLLAIACLIESRLGRKAYVYGDITKGQCDRAVRMANEYLDRKIDTPDQCDMNRLFLRIDGLSLSETEKLGLFVGLYLGRKDTDFGLYVRSHFSEEASDKYWAERFSEYQVPTIGFDNALEQYLLWGYDFEKLCSFVSYTDNDGATHYADFVKRIMKAELHRQNKDCTDSLKIDSDEEEPYGIGTLFAQFFLAGARNKRIDRYIPIDEIRASLSRALGNLCPVDEIIDEYLQMERAQELPFDDSEVSDEKSEEAEPDVSSLLTRAVKLHKEYYNVMGDAYDVYTADALPYYASGDTVSPQLLDATCKSLAFYQGILSEKRYSELMAKAPLERCRYLVQQNRRIWLRDKDWEKIFDDIMNCPESFERYYPMVRVKANNEDLRSMVRAFVVNDELYSYVSRLVANAHE